MDRLVGLSHTNIIPQSSSFECRRLVSSMGYLHDNDKTHFLFFSKSFGNCILKLCCFSKIVDRIKNKWLLLLLFIYIVPFTEWPISEWFIWKSLSEAQKMYQKGNLETHFIDFLKITTHSLWYGDQLYILLVFYCYRLLLKVCLIKEDCFAMERDLWKKRS